MFHSFFNSLARSRYLSFFSHSFSFILWSAGTAKSTILQVLFFLLIIIRSGLLAEIRWSVCMSKSHRSLCVLFSRAGAGLCIYHLLVWSNFNFLYISQWITLSIQSRFFDEVQVLVSLLAFFYFQSVIYWNSKIHETASSLYRSLSGFFFFFFFLLINQLQVLSSGWSVYISKSQKIFFIAFPTTNSSLCIYHLVEWSKFNFSHNSQGITFPRPGVSSFVLF